MLIDLLYLLVAALASPYIAWKMATTRRFRTGLLERLGVDLTHARRTPSTGLPSSSLRAGRAGGDRPCIWVHGVSVGEVIASKPLVREIERELPGFEVVISTTTSAGLEVARKQFAGKRSFHYPLDLSFAVQRVLKAVRPDVILLVELEIWPNFLRAAFRDQIPVVLVNGRISEKSYKGYRFVKKLLFRPLEKIRRFCVQTEIYAERFLKLGVPAPQILVTGTLKYDALPVPDDAARLDIEYRKKLSLGAAPVLVAGSTHAPEERELLTVYKRLRAKIADLRLVLVPRHLERTEDVLRDVRDAGLLAVRKTEIDAGRAALSSDGASVLVVDTIGELANIYAAATVVFVGGTLTDRGGQNMLEPAGLGRATVFGPRVENFRESADMLLAAGGAAQVADAAGLEGLLTDLLADAPRREEMGRRARAAIDARRGAARKTVGALKDVIKLDTRLERRLADAGAEPIIGSPTNITQLSNAGT